LGDPASDEVHEDYADRRRVFDLASLTKALVTTPLAFKVGATDGTVGSLLGEKAHDLRPELRALTLKSLLRHESGLPAWRNFYVCRTPLVEGLNRAADAIDAKKPQVYSDIGFLLLGLVIERLGGAGLATQFDQLATPGLHYATRLANLADDAITTGYCAIRQRQLVGEVHDENCWSLGGETAHAGVFGSGPALVAYLRQFAATDLGRRVISANAAARGEPPNQPCMGWRQGADQTASGFHGGAAMGHMGFTGTAFWLYPETGEYAMLLTNRIVSARVNPAISAMRRAVFTAFGS
jgi:CubicO group peptidase (beta-lactamase class C family)